MAFFTYLVGSLGGFQGILDLAKGGLQVAGAIRNMNPQAENPMDNPAIVSLLQQRAQINAYAKAIADENDPLRKRMLENNMAALQSQTAEQIRNLERSVQRRIASGKPSLGGGIVPGSDPRRRDESVAGIVNQLAGVTIPNAARTQTLQQLQAAAGAASGGPSAASAIPSIEALLDRNRTRDVSNQGFGGLINVLEQIGGLGDIFGGGKQGEITGGQGDDTLGRSGGGNDLLSLFSNQGGTQYAGISNKFNQFGVS